MGKLHHLIAELAENLYKFLEGADSLQVVEGYQHLRGERSDQSGEATGKFVFLRVEDVAGYKQMALKQQRIIKKKCLYSKSQSLPYLITEPQIIFIHYIYITLFFKEMKTDIDIFYI